MYHTRDELQKEVIDLNRLNPDVNGDGKVSASEARIYSLLRKQDTSGDGKLTIGELYKGLEALTNVEKKRSMFTKGFFVMSAVSLIQVLLIVGLVTGIVVALKDQFVADNTLTFLTSDNGAPLGNDGQGNLPLRGGKTMVWEGGYREPGIAHWPGTIAAASVSFELVLSLLMQVAKSVDKVRQ